MDNVRYINQKLQAVNNVYNMYIHILKCLMTNVLNNAACSASKIDSKKGKNVLEFYIPGVFKNKHRQVCLSIIHKKNTEWSPLVNKLERQNSGIEYMFPERSQLLLFVLFFIYCYHDHVINTEKPLIPHCRYLVYFFCRCYVNIGR